MKSRRILSIIGLTLAAVLLLGIGFAIGRNDEKKTVLVAPTESTAPRLIISAVHADSEYTSEKIQQTNDGTSDLDFCCIGLTDVTIDLGGNVMDLGNALREGKTSLSEISFLAQSDSQSVPRAGKVRTALQNSVIPIPTLICGSSMTFTKRLMGYSI